MSDQATGLVPAEVPTEKKHPLGWLLEQIAEQLPGAVKEEEGTIPSQTLAKMWGFAERIKDANFLPKHAKGDRSAVFFLLSMGHEMGARWTHAIRSLYVTPDGKVGMQGDYALALLLSKGFRVFWPVQSDDRGVCQICRPNCECPYDAAKKMVACVCGRSGEMEVTFAEMHAAGLTTKASSNELKFNWRNKKNMLRWRSFMFGARLYAADVLAGLYLLEELEEIETQDKPTPESIARAAGTDQNVEIDRAIIPEEAESILRHAAQEAGVVQGWVVGRMVEIQAKVLSAWTPEASVKDLAEPLLKDALAELQQIKAQKATNGGQQTKPRRGRPPKPTAMEQATAPAPPAPPAPGPVAVPKSESLLDFPDPLA